MMKFIIHYTIHWYEDQIVVEWETIEEIRETVDKEMQKRWAEYQWSEQVED